EDDGRTGSGRTGAGRGASPVPGAINRTCQAQVFYFEVCWWGNNLGIVDFVTAAKHLYSCRKNRAAAAEPIPSNDCGAEPDGAFGYTSWARFRLAFPKRSLRRHVS